MWPRATSEPTPAAVFPRGRQAAVIDVGSNSVRLVLYRLEGRAIWTVFNEKALAGLGRNVPATGRLSPEGVETAITALRRFRSVLAEWADAEVMAVATAAVREAQDGEAFVARVDAETGIGLRILSGAEEARYAALGVRAGQPDARGVAGDLGGSSLELVHLDSAAPSGVTLPLGPFALGAPRPLDSEQVRKRVSQRLDEVASDFRSKTFHAVGGAWRNLALLHMEMADYPLRVAHQYEMSRSDALDVSRFVARQSRASLERMVGLSKKRFDTLPYSALVLEAVIERLGVERLVISAYGLREGLLLESMRPEVRDKDPLIEGFDALSQIRGLSHDLGGALEAWIAPALSVLPKVFGDREPVLNAAACRIADLGARLHPDHRGELTFEIILRAPVAGMSHAERAFLACAGFARHNSSSNLPQPDMLARLLTPERRQRARALGAAIRLGCDLSGRNAALLRHVKLQVRGEELLLCADEAHRDLLLGEQIAKRAQTLAQALRLKLTLP